MHRRRHSAAEVIAKSLTAAECGATVGRGGGRESRQRHEGKCAAHQNCS
jgi:hypothetical protein